MPAAGPVRKIEAPNSTSNARTLPKGSSGGKIRNSCSPAKAHESSSPPRAPRTRARETADSSEAVLVLKSWPAILSQSPSDERFELPFREGAFFDHTY